MNEKRNIKILGVITNETTNKIKTNKYIDELSTRLFNENISHLIVEDSVDGKGIMLIEDAPSLFIHNDKEGQWEYLAKYMNDDNSEPILLETMILEDNNKEADIVNFIKVILYCMKEDE